MTLDTTRILRIELTVTDLSRAERFFVDGLGFTVVRRGDVDAAMATVPRAGRITSSELRRGGQTLVLQAFQPPGARYPYGAVCSDQLFQHFAIPVVDMDASLARLRAVQPLAISNRPQRLPARSGGVVAFKFRDPDGHPLELIEFPDGHDDGIDHSAIVVMDVERSIAFYRDQLGFKVASRQINMGLEQDQLDDLTDVTVDVVALTPHQMAPHPIGPHLELLGYRSPPVRPAAPRLPHDVAATRLVLEVDGLEVEGLPGDAMRLPDGMWAMLIHDPDGHGLVLISKS